MIDKRVVNILYDYGHPITGIARRMGVTHGRISQILNGKHRNNHGCEICRFLSKENDYSTVEVLGTKKMKVCGRCFTTHFN